MISAKYRRCARSYRSIPSVCGKKKATRISCKHNV